MSKYTPELIGSGQFGTCAKCSLMPTAEGHDGCLGTLDPAVVMNACCGHGDNSQAYIQFWDSSIVRGTAALEIITKLNGNITKETTLESIRVNISKINRQLATK